MSLINEALRKARREAAGEAGDALRASAPSSLRRGQRLPWRTAAVCTGAVFAVAIGAGGTWWVLRGGVDEPQRPLVSADAPVPPVPVAVHVSPVGEGSGSPAAVVTSAPTEIEPSPVGARPTATETPPPAPTATPTPAGPDDVGPDGELIFDVVADSGGLSLSLGYLVYRPVDPFAEINGEEVRVGSVVAGCTVLAIGRTSVTLRCVGDTVVLRTG